MFPFPSKTSFSVTSALCILTVWNVYTSRLGKIFECFHVPPTFPYIHVSKYVREPISWIINLYLLDERVNLYLCENEISFIYKYISYSAKISFKQQIAIIFGTLHKKIAMILRDGTSYLTFTAKRLKASLSTVKRDTNSLANRFRNIGRDDNFVWTDGKFVKTPRQREKKRKRTNESLIS